MLLRRAIDSVLEQSYENLELIVVDDASDDGTQSMLSTIDDERLTVIRLDRARGAAAARNVGLRAGHGELVAFQDSDTRWVPDRLASHVTTFAQSGPGTGVVYGFVESSPSTGRVRSPSHLDARRTGSLLDVLIRYNIVDLPASTISRRALDEVGGFDEELPRYQDWELFLRLSRAFEFAFCDAVAVIGDDNTDRISLDADAEFAAVQRLLRRHAGLFRRDPRAATAWRMHLLAESSRRRRWRDVLRWSAQALREPTALAGWVREWAAGVPHANDRVVRPMKPQRGRAP